MVPFTSCYICYHSVFSSFTLSVTLIISGSTLTVSFVYHRTNIAPLEYEELPRHDVKISSTLSYFPCRISSPFIRTLRTFTPGTCTWGFETTGTDPSVACLVLRWTWWREFPMTTTGPSSKLLHCGVVVSVCWSIYSGLILTVITPTEVCVSVPLILSSAGSLLICTVSHWPHISDNKSDESHDSDGYVESSSICHMVLNKNTNTKQP